MYVFRTPGEKVWHVMVTIEHCQVGHIHTAPAACLRRNIRACDRMDNLRAHHEGLMMCGYCIEAICRTPDPTIECSEIKNLG